MKNKRLEKMIEVEWVDATEGAKKIGEYENLGVKDFLTVRYSYGVILKEDNDGIVMITTLDEDKSIEYLAIPRVWIKRYKVKTKK